ncbi:hypothetical protein BSU04_20040 [Caballeronia sordidicola]|uniref:Uncharacterized protein n=1 Tax=Caballeronia sordidicola TaxID=196367 RepID=A0A226X026_CABSO|nr:hypothetical protein BSU04_20040 [Caballeronia sordidicola]
MMTTSIDVQETCHTGFNSSNFVDCQQFKLLCGTSGIV